jgi:hypothetical protein
VVKLQAKVSGYDPKTPVTFVIFEKDNSPNEAIATFELEVPEEDKPCEIIWSADYEYPSELLFEFQIEDKKRKTKKALKYDMVAEAAKKDKPAEAKEGEDKEKKEEKEPEPDIAASTGDLVRLIAVTQGFVPGSAVMFSIYPEGGSSEEAIATVSGNVDPNQVAEAEWICEHEQDGVLLFDATIEAITSASENKLQYFAEVEEEETELEEMPHEKIEVEEPKAVAARPVPPKEEVEVEEEATEYGAMPHAAGPPPPPLPPAGPAEAAVEPGGPIDTGEAPAVLEEEEVEEEKTDVALEGEREAPAGGIAPAAEEKKHPKEPTTGVSQPEEETSAEVSDEIKFTPGPEEAASEPEIEEESTETASMPHEEAEPKGFAKRPPTDSQDKDLASDEGTISPEQ